MLTVTYGLTFYWGCASKSAKPQAPYFRKAHPAVCNRLFSEFIQSAAPPANPSSCLYLELCVGGKQPGGTGVVMEDRKAAPVLRACFLRS